MNMRSLARYRAKVRMKAMGMRHICKGGSFRWQWREFGFGGKKHE